MIDDPNRAPVAPHSHTQRRTKCPFAGECESVRNSYLPRPRASRALPLSRHATRHNPGGGSRLMGLVFRSGHVLFMRSFFVA
jgi:hypothetical protein